MKTKAPSPCKQRDFSFRLSFLITRRYKNHLKIFKKYQINVIIQKNKKGMKNMDISVKIGDYILNVRAAIIVIHDNKLMVHHDVKLDHYALPGGRIEIGENSKTTVKREIIEEMGKEIEITGYISTIENLFIMNGNKYHEIMFVYKAEFKNKEDKLIQQTIKNVEGNDYLQYEWIDLEEIDKMPLKPQAIKEILKKGEFPVHKINDDIGECV